MKYSLRYAIFAALLFSIGLSLTMAGLMIPGNQFFMSGGGGFLLGFFGVNLARYFFANKRLD